MEKNKINTARTIAIISCVYMLSHVLILDWGWYIDACVPYYFKLSWLFYLLVDISGPFVLLGTAFILYALLTKKHTLLPAVFLIMLPGPVARCLYLLNISFLYARDKTSLLLSLLGLAVALILLFFQPKGKKLWFIPCLLLGIALPFSSMSSPGVSPWFLKASLLGNEFVEPVRIAIHYLFCISATVMLGAVCYYRAAAIVSSNTGIPESTSATVPSTMFSRLEKLKELLDNGLITQEEFDAKKKEILRL